MKNKAEHAAAVESAITTPGNKLKKIKSILEDCLRSGASLDEFRILIARQI